MSRRKFRSPVPRKVSKDAIEDTDDRKWLKKEPKESDDDFFTAWDGDYWYVWFRDNVCPEEDEIIYFDHGAKGTTFKVERVYRLYDEKRAVVEMEVYKDT